MNIFLIVTKRANAWQQDPLMRAVMCPRKSRVATGCIGATKQTTQNRTRSIAGAARGQKYCSLICVQNFLHCWVSSSEALPSSSLWGGGGKPACLCVIFHRKWQDPRPNTATSDMHKVSKYALKCLKLEKRNKHHCQVVNAYCLYRT